MKATRQCLLKLFAVAAPVSGAFTANILLRQGYVGQVAVATTNPPTKIYTLQMKSIFAIVLFFALFALNAQEVPLEQKYAKILQKMDCGVYVSAIEDLKNEIEKLEKPGGNNAELALLYRLCGSAYESLEDTKNAGYYYSNFLKCFEDSTKQISPEDIYSMIEIAGSLYGHILNDPVKAEKMFLHVNQLAQKCCKEKISDAILSIARFHIANGNYEKAFQIPTEYMKKMEAEKGLASIEYADSLLILSVFKDKVGFYGETILLTEKALRIYRAKNGESAPDNLIPLSMLFSLYNGSCANYDKALATLDEMVSIAQKNNGFELKSDRLSEIRPNLREIISFAASKKKEDRVDKITELLTNSPITDESMLLLNKLDNDCRRFGLKTPEKASGKIQQCKDTLGDKLRETKQKYGINSLETYKIYGDLNRFYSSSENSTAAMKSLQDAYNIKKNIFGADSPETLSDLEIIYYSRTPEDDLEYIDAAMEIVKKQFGEEHPLYASWVSRKATDISVSEDGYEKLLLKALETTQKYYGNDSPVTAYPLEELLNYYSYREIPPASEKIIMSLEKAIDKFPWNTKLNNALDSLKKSLPTPTFETVKFNDTLAKILALYKKNFGADNVQQIPFLIESIKFKEKVGASPDKLKDIATGIISIYKKAEGENNPFAALYYLQLKEKLESTDAVRDDLESALSEGLEISEKNFGGKDILTAKCLVALSDLYLKSGKNLNKAEEYLNRTLLIYEKLDFLTTEHEECLRELMSLYPRDPEKQTKYENLLKELRKKYKWENE